MSKNCRGVTELGSKLRLMDSQPTAISTKLGFALEEPYGKLIAISAWFPESLRNPDPLLGRAWGKEEVEGGSCHLL